MRLACTYNMFRQVAHSTLAILQRSIATSPLWVSILRGANCPPKVAQVGIYGADPPNFCTDHCGVKYNSVFSFEVAR